MAELNEHLNIANLETFFLARLERFARLNAEAHSHNIAQWDRLARASTLGAYRDCIALGLEEEARKILVRHLGQRLVA